MQIPFVNLDAQYLPIDDEVQAAVSEVLKSRKFVLGDYVEAFEGSAASYLGVKHAVGVGNGSDAIWLALQALEIGEGDEVITVPHTYIATPEAIYRCGAKVVFCDITEDTWCMDPEKLKALITPKTKAILPVHIYGQCADITAIREVAGDIPIVEDAAQCWGAEHHGKKAGSLGDIACFSFYPTKTLGAAGDGGLVTSSNDELADRIRALRVHGESKRYFNAFHGMNSRLDGIQAAILSVKLRHVDAWNAGRADIAEYYRSRFEGSDVKLGVVGEGNTHVWHQCVATLPKRDELRAHLQEKGIGSAIYYPVPQHMQRCFEDLGYKEGDFPVSESLAREGVALPCWPEMTEEMRVYVADNVLGFYGS